jgi:hypothetical protein
LTDTPRIFWKDDKLKEKRKRNKKRLTCEMLNSILVAYVAREG